VASGSLIRWTKGFSIENAVRKLISIWEVCLLWYISFLCDLINKSWVIVIVIDRDISNIVFVRLGRFTISFVRRMRHVIYMENWYVFVKLLFVFYHTQSSIPFVWMPWLHLWLHDFSTFYLSCVYI
jgi:hypothetical protein